MPQFDASTPRLSRVYQDHPVTVPAAITGGHTLTDTEAAWVNSTVATIIGNGLGGVIRREIKKVDDHRAALHKQGKYDGPMKGKVPAAATAADLNGFDPQETVDELYAKYVLAPGAEKSASDPLSKMIRALAEADASARIKAKGHTVAAFRKADASTDAHANRYDEFVAKIIFDKGDTFRAQAEAVLSAGAATTEDDDADLTL